MPEANEDKLWAAVGHLRWSDELDEHGDEKGWDLTILNAEPTRSLSAQEVTRQIARPLSTGHQEQTHPSILAEQEAAQAAGQAILAQQQAVGAGVPAQRPAPAAAAARTAPPPPPPSVAPSPGLGKAASAAGSEPSVSDYASVIEADDRSGRPIRGFPQQLEPTTIAPGQVIGYRGLSRPATLAANPTARLAVVRACPLEKHLAETRPAKLPRAWCRRVQTGAGGPSGKRHALRPSVRRRPQRPAVRARDLLRGGPGFGPGLRRPAPVAAGRSWLRSRHQVHILSALAYPESGRRRGLPALKGRRARSFQRRVQGLRGRIEGGGNSRQPAPTGLVRGCGRRRPWAVAL